MRLWYDYLIETDLRRDPSNPVGRGTHTRRGGLDGVRSRGLLPRYERQPWIPGDDQGDAFLTVVLHEGRRRNQAMNGGGVRVVNERAGEWCARHAAFGPAWIVPAGCNRSNPLHRRT